MTRTRITFQEILWIIRMVAVILLAKLAELIVPQDAKKTVNWLRKRPMEE